MPAELKVGISLRLPPQRHDFYVFHTPEDRMSGNASTDYDLTFRNDSPRRLRENHAKCVKITREFHATGRTSSKLPSFLGFLNLAFDLRSIRQL
ncbi:MAG TPA: hypothetical protein PLT00_02745 [Verrucomicrobiota bacterium]|jgi:hypothetical protein|nr:MAG: hypothetical protein BWX84_00990 [Verrucomicrobia bacterium ADurb.Bin118]HPY29560.1 hypothetical protein [Verrucomicrobiota bacterium]HQB15613.1 hypothetical protein [Verrucomicrobiota bacterium]